MCTVTYIPQGDGSFILTHNRDESVRRKIATPPVRREIGGVGHFFPIDPEGKGTWIGASETGRVASLMNGGRFPYKRKPNYRHSRGLIIPEYFRYPDFISFYNDYDFSGLEPFTLLVFEEGNVYEAVLDEDRVQFRRINAEKPLIYSSSPLYTEASRERKRGAFVEWYLSVSPPDPENIMQFHRGQLFEHEPDKSRIPAGHILRTVSITSIIKRPDRVKIHYYDQLNDLNFNTLIRVRKNISLAT